MAHRLAGKIAVISGGARGIGEAAARLFVEHGAKVIVGDILDQDAERVADELGPDNARSVHLDVTREDDWHEALRVTESAFGPPNVLVNNAGLMVVGPTEVATAADFRKVFEVNVVGAFLGTRTMIEPMRANGGGSIVIMSSGAAIEGTPGLPAYAASKAANANFTKTAALELGRYGIRVNAICPGGIDTAMSNLPEFDGMDKDGFYSKLPVPRIGRVDDIAPLCVFLASDESNYMTGSVVLCDGGMLAGHYAI